MGFKKYIYTGTIILWKLLDTSFGLLYAHFAAVIRGSEFWLFGVIVLVVLVIVLGYAPCCLLLLTYVGFRWNCAFLIWIFHWWPRQVEYSYWEKKCNFNGNIHDRNKKFERDWSQWQREQFDHSLTILFLNFWANDWPSPEFDQFVWIVCLFRHILYIQFIFRRVTYFPPPYPFLYVVLHILYTYIPT